MNGQTKTSAWAYIGSGCTALVVVGVLFVAAVIFFGYRLARQVRSEQQDPQARESRAKEVLGAQALPDGYHPMLSVSIPFVMDVAMLSDREPDADGRVNGFDQRGFLFFQFLTLGGAHEQELRDYFEGKTQDDSVLRRHRINVRMHAKELIRRGVVHMDGYDVLYLAQRGDLDMREGRAEGVSSLMLVECGQDTRRRMAIWFGPDPDPKAPVARVNFTGTPADESAIHSFLGHFNLCHRT